jgi:integrase
MRVQRLKGISPKSDAPKEKTFEGVAREWHTAYIAPSKAPQYVYKVLSRLEKFLFPHLGARLIGEIRSHDVLTPLRAIEALGMNETAHTVRQIAGQVFRYAVASGYAEHDVTADLRGALAPVVVRHNASITSPREIAGLLTSMRAFEGSPVVRAALWFSAYSFLRPGEVRRLEWAEVDSETAEVRISAEKMKMRRPHILPLSRQAADILRAMRPLTGHGRYVFPSIRVLNAGNVPMSENTITAALRRLGFGGDKMTAHGFRSMASTNLNEQGWPPDVVERQLAHAEGSSARAAYNYAQYLPERRKMMQWWADWLDGLKQ